MIRVGFFVPFAALVLTGCLSGGANPSCRPAVLSSGTYQICDVGNVIIMEPISAAPYVAADAGDPDPASEPPAVIEAPEPVEPPAGEEPVVITSTHRAR